MSICLTNLNEVCVQQTKTDKKKQQKDNKNLDVPAAKWEIYSYCFELVVLNILEIQAELGSHYWCINRTLQKLTFNYTYNVLYLIGHWLISAHN